MSRSNSNPRTPRRFKSASLHAVSLMHFPFITPVAAAFPASADANVMEKSHSCAIGYSSKELLTLGIPLQGTA